MRSSRRVFPVLASLLLLVGCEAVGGGQVGPCDVVTESPLLTITEVRAEASRTPIGAVALTDFVVEGDSLPVAFLDPDESMNAEVDGDTLRCTVPCSFAYQEGTYTFTATAPGFASTRVRLGEVSYPTREEEGPCPRIIFSGTNEVEIALEAE